MPLPFSVKIRRLLAVFGLLAFLVVLTISIAYETWSTKAEIAGVMKDTARSCTSLIHDSIHQYRLYMKEIISQMPRGDDETVRRYFREALPFLGPEDHYFLLNRDGMVIVTARGDEAFIGLDFSNQPYVQERNDVSSVHQSIVTLKPVVSLLYPMADGRNLIVEKDLLSIAPLVRHLTIGGQLHKAFLFILSSEGTVIYHPNQDLTKSRYNLGFELEGWSDPNTHGLETYQHQGMKYLCYREKFNVPLGWTFYAAIPYTEVMIAAGKKIGFVAVTIAGIFLALLVVLEVLLRRSFSGPLSRISRHLSRLNPLAGKCVLPEEMAANTHEFLEIIEAANRMSENVRLSNEKVSESEERFRSLVQQAGDGFFVHDDEGNIVDVNQRGCEMLGYSREELLKLTIFDIDKEVGYERANKIWEELQLGQTITLETRNMRKDGTTFPSDIRLGRIQMGNGKYFLGLVRDISLRKFAEQALANEKELLSVTLRSIGDGVITTDVDGRVVMLSRVAETLTGWSQEEAQGLPLAEVFKIINEYTRKPCENPVTQVLAGGHIVGLANHTVLVSKAGNEMIIADSAAPIRDRESRIVGVVLVFRDITEEKRLQREAQKARNLESLGILAGGIAHDFNNLLTAILGNVSFAKIHSNKDSDAYDHLVAAEKASLRAKDLTLQLLTFAKGGEPIKQAVAIVDIIRESADFVLLGSNVSYEMDADEELWPVKVDPGQMSQLFNNLIINASQAMPDGGVIRVKCGNIYCDGDKRHSLKPGRYVLITVADHGKGISKTDMQRIFDPYFTTKQEGSGLGLASSYSIAKRHGGHLAVESQVGKGSTFFVYLPTTGKKVAMKEEAFEETAIVRGKGKILVMDDEQMVRDMAGKVLAYIGYDADFAQNGQEAINLYSEAMQTDRPYDAVIMDLTIPGGMGGKEAVREILKINGSAKVIVSSGYAQDPIMADYKSHGFGAVLTKPYSIENLSQTLHDLLFGSQSV